MPPWLDEIEEDLLARRNRAEHEGWLGEVEGIDLTLTFLRQKREQTQGLARTTSIDLGLPAVRTTAPTNRTPRPLVRRPTKGSMSLA